jgi:hypothetical protein
VAPHGKLIIAIYNDTGSQGDFKKVDDTSAPCDGTTEHDAPLDGR